MKPHDLIRVTYANGVNLFWEVEAVLLGATDQESVIELRPVGQRPNAWGKTLCPAPLLFVLAEGGSVTVYSAPGDEAPDSPAAGDAGPAGREK